MKGSMDDLEVALSAARDNLKSLDEKIGRERDTRKRPHWERDNGNGQHKSFGDGDRRPGPRKDHPSSGGPSAKRSNVFTRLEPRQNKGRNAELKEEPVVRPRLSSRVTKEIPRREDVVAAQSTDEQSRARNRRMFGSLLGTLNKFCQDESRIRGQVEKKAIIERRVEEQELRERETIKQERRNMLADRKKKFMEVRLLEIKMERMQDLAVFEETQKHTRAFIRTSAGPKIFFLPKIMNEKTTQLLLDSQRAYDEELAKKREDIAKELLQVEERLQRELEKSLEEKPQHVHQDGEKETRDETVARGQLRDEEVRSDADEGEEEDEGTRPRLTSQVVKSHVEVSIKNVSPPAERRHVNQKMVISLVNDVYGGASGGRDRI